MSMTISSTKTVGEIVLELPQATRIFESMKIDYCCGGDRPVGEACSSAGVDFENLARMLEDVSANEVKGNGAFDFQQATLTELIAHILDKHHVYTKEEMVRLESLSEKVISAHGGNHSELLAIRSLLQQLFAGDHPAADPQADWSHRLAVALGPVAPLAAGRRRRCGHGWVGCFRPDRTLVRLV